MLSADVTVAVAGLFDPLAHARFADAPRHRLIEPHGREAHAGREVRVAIPVRAALHAVPARHVELVLHGAGFEANEVR